MVNFLETRRRPTTKENLPSQYKRQTRVINTHETDHELEINQLSESESDDTRDYRIARAPSRSNKAKKITTENTEKTNTDKPYTPITDQNKSICMEKLDKLTSDIASISQRLDQLQNQVYTPNKTTKQHNNSNYKSKPNYQKTWQVQTQVNQNPAHQQKYRNQNNRGQALSTSACFRCGQEGHFSRECPSAPWMTGHMEVAVQPNVTCPSYATQQIPQKPATDKTNQQTSQPSN